MRWWAGLAMVGGLSTASANELISRDLAHRALLDAWKKLGTRVAGPIPPALSDPSKEKSLPILSSHRGPCEPVLARIRDTHGKAAEGAVILGSMDALKGRSTCWIMESDTAHSGGTGAVVDAFTGKVLLMWTIPEG